MAYADPDDPRQKISTRKYYEKNKAEYFARNKAKRSKLRDMMQAAKSIPCMDCLIEYPYYVMDFDHRVGEIKLYDPSRLVSMGSIKKLTEEIAKCDVVCSNCHRQRTNDRRLAGFAETDTNEPTSEL